MEPRTPTHSLPSYDEPTPETRGRMSREEEAERALKRTEFTTGTRGVLISLFLLTIVSVATVQFIAQPLPKVPLGTFLHAEQIKSFEKQLETDSVVAQWLLPPTQAILTGKLGAGSEQVYLGRAGWLYYRPDVDYVTGPPFLSSAWLKHREQAAKVQPDPVKAIVHFHQQLAARGIELVLLPVSPKTAAKLQNASFEEFKKRMAAANVRIFECSPDYLRTDTHWRPESMEQIAKDLAESLQLPSSENRELQITEAQVNGMGDVARMLRLPDEHLYPRQDVTIHQITSGDAFWRPTRDADVLLLGDSFANMYSLGALGWGESAGLAEHLSYSLGGRPLDCIMRNSDGAFATREILARELARGRDRLAGKKLIVWEFAARELAFGDWKMIELKVGQPGEAKFFSPKPGETLEASGTIESISQVPRPGTVPYRDHVMSVQVSELRMAGASQESLQAVVYLLSMQDNVWTAAARLRVGDKISLKLRAWADVSAQYEQINRSEQDDPALQLEEPVWGELLP